MRVGPAVVFDLDGVLSDATARQRFLEAGRKDWSAFYEACGEDPVVEEGTRLLGLLGPTLCVVLLTGRPERVQARTLEWLHRADLRWDLLIMRPPGDHLRVSEYKRRALRALRAEGLEVRFAVEDDPQNHAVYLEEGVPCLYVHSGYYA